MLYGDTKTIVDALDAAISEFETFFPSDQVKAWIALRDELVNGHKILSPWQIEDAYHQGDCEMDDQGNYRNDLTEAEAVEALKRFGDNDYYIEQGNEAMSDIVDEIVSGRGL